MPEDGLIKRSPALKSADAEEVEIFSARSATTSMMHCATGETVSEPTPILLLRRRAGRGYDRSKPWL
jgi:hypothetical protein